MEFAGHFEDLPLEGRCWRHGDRTFTHIFDSLQHRVDQCMNESEAFQQCSLEAEALHIAMEEAPITEWRRNYLGEQHRIVARAQALRAALEAQDPTVRQHPQWTCPQQPPGGACAAPPAVHAAEAARAAPLGDDDVTPTAALTSTCLLMAALFEQTPFSDTDVRRRVYQDFTTLKREFRHTHIRTLHGPTTSVGELFGSIKDLDKQGLTDNVQAIVFDDWTVHRRVDSFLNADIAVVATALTQEGPVGRVSFKLRTFIVLSLLQERLLKDLFVGRFVGQQVRGCEIMGTEDAMDYFDWVEAMVRNTPNAYAASRGLYYAWLYAPEVSATPEHWAAIFGPGANRLPSLYDGITTPDDTVVADATSDSGYSMDVAAALGHEYADANAQAAVGYPWADDFLGAYLRKHKERRAQQAQQAQQQAGVKQEQQQQAQQQAGVKQEEQQQQQQGQGQDGSLRNGGCSNGGSSGGSPPAASSSEQLPCSMEEDESMGALANNEGLLMRAQREGGACCKPEEGREAGGAGGGGRGGLGAEEGPEAKRAKCERGCLPGAAAAGSGATPGAGAAGKDGDRGAHGAGPGPGSEAASAAWAWARKHLHQQQHAPAQPGSPTGPAAAAPPDRLPLPLGIFLVGLITSSAYTNTQIHIEDLMLMSININIFGAPKVWWWIPQAQVPAFKPFAEALCGRGDLYTKAVAPFLLDKSTTPHEHRLPLSKLKEFGARRVMQMPGMAILTSPGYAFHFTTSMGFNVAESCNLFLEIMGWDLQRLWKERPAEQYPDPENSMVKWMSDNGVLQTLGLKGTGSPLQARPQ